MGARPPDPREADDGRPAPGEYDLPASPTGPAYTMRPRPPEPRNEVRPGLRYIGEGSAQDVLRKAVGRKIAWDVCACVCRGLRRRTSISAFLL